MHLSERVRPTVNDSKCCIRNLLKVYEMHLNPIFVKKFAKNIWSVWHDQSGILGMERYPGHGEVSQLLLSIKTWYCAERFESLCRLFLTIFLGPLTWIAFMNFRTVLAVWNSFNKNLYFLYENKIIKMFIFAKNVNFQPKITQTFSSISLFSNGEKNKKKIFISFAPHFLLFYR